MNRTIIHLNIADFAVAVERTLDRRLRERPVIEAPLGAPRAAVYDMSEEAYQAGVYKGMPLAAARRICREAHLQMPRLERYIQAMAALIQRARPFTPRIEPGLDDGHLFLDVTGTSRLHGSPEDVAQRLRRQICSDLDLTPIWSVASNKVVAKVATRTVKPLGECDGPGECLERMLPEVQCLAVWEPVCGCDQITYSNACYAAEAVVSLLSDGSCGTGEPCSEDDDCDLALGQYCRTDLGYCGGLAAGLWV